MTYTYFAELIIWPLKKQAITSEKKHRERRLSSYLQTAVWPVVTWMEDFVGLESRVEPLLPRMEQVEKGQREYHDVVGFEFGIDNEVVSHLHTSDMAKRSPSV